MDCIDILHTWDCIFEYYQSMQKETLDVGLILEPTLHIFAHKSLHLQLKVESMAILT